MYRLIQKITSSTWAVLAIFWITLFLLYLPAAQSGWVSDTLGWLDAIRHQSFADYINRTHTGLPTFYQTTQVVTWSLYKLFGTNHWAWHLIHVSLHAVNCTLLFVLLRTILNHRQINSATGLAFAAAVLFCTSPYVGEVIVWEASFHYLQAVLFILITLILIVRYLAAPRPFYALIAALVFFIAIFSLELFYLTPLFTGSLLIYYRRGLKYEAAVVKRAALYFLLPQVLLFTLHLTLARVLLGTATARLGDQLMHMPLTYYAIKPPDYIFHLLWGRFLPQAIRNGWHAFFCTYIGAALFYSLLLGVIILIAIRLKRMSNKGRLISLFSYWLIMSVGIVTPMWFPERMLIIGDRYLYILLPWFFTLLVLLISYIRQGFARRALLIVTCGLNILLAFYLNMVWQTSTRVTDALQKNIPYDSTGVTVLLNSPAFFKGAPMIGAAPDHEFVLMHNLLYPNPIKSPVLEALACNVTSPDDSVIVNTLNDSTLRVTLAVPEARWWYGTDLARDYSNHFYTVSLSSDSRSYILSLKQSAFRYRLLYQKGSNWHIVKLNIRQSCHNSKRCTFAALW